MTTKKDIGFAIRTLRKKAGIKTQEELGKKLNPKPISKGAMNQIETGKSNYGIDTLFRIAEVLNCDVSDFFESQKDHSRISMFESFLEDYEKKIIEEERARYKK